MPSLILKHRIATPTCRGFLHRCIGFFGLAGICFFPLPGSMVLAGIACGAGHGSLFPVLNALSVSRAPAHLHGVVISVHTAALDLGGVLGTPICGAVAHAFGYRTMFTGVAAGALCGLGIMLWDRARKL